MGEGFLVDVPGLGQLITTLSEAADRMRMANDRLRAASAADLGSGDLDRAAADFQDRWEYGIGKISDASGKMTDSLREAKQLYEQTDQAIAALFPDPGSPGPDSGGPDSGTQGTTADGSSPATPEASSPINQALDGGPAR
ncbi:MAG: WXG100 family type VII secretion target [Pseudonocardiaceae bacterium]